MKKKIKLAKKTIQKLKLKLKPKSDRKVAPLIAIDENPSVGEPGCTHGSTC
ncbi:MAG TPA: hypothetical protein VND93_06950 [Myxococcales bacterium]|nr:hypothetical protein [Myxococcales bacterium]